MTKIDNLNANEAEKIWQAIRALQYKTTLNSSAIGRGGLTVYDGGMITIENGGLRVTGSAEIIGSLIASGTIDFSGEVYVSGPLVVQAGGSVTIGSIEFQPDGSASFATLTIGPDGTLTTGSTKINPDGSADFGLFKIAANGDLISQGTLDIQGTTTLKSDLNVTGNGRIKAGVTQINPDGTISFGPSLSITPDNGLGDAAIMAGASQIVLTPDNPDYWAQFTGGAYFQGLIRAMGLKLSSALPTTTEPPNLHIDASGNVKRSTA